MSTMQALYDLEINVSVTSFWDIGFEVKLGDATNGFVAEYRASDWEEAERWLNAKARQHYPDRFVG
jgi:hypothetical protein